MSSLLKKFRGTGVALVTPFKKGKIDFDALEQVVEHTISGGVDYLVCLGTTGESSTLSEKEQRQVLDFVIKTNAARLPLVAGVFGGNNTDALCKKVKSFNFEGIDVLLSSNPAYNKPGQEGLFRHYMALAEVSPKPIMIYNVPSRTSCNITAETALRLAHGSEKFMGIKEASDDMMQIMRIIRGKPEHFLVLSGDDFLSLAILACGGDGVVSVISNVVPRQFTTLIRAALNQDYMTAQKLNLQLLDLYKLMFVEGNPAGAKAGLECLGICSRELRLPLTEMTEVNKGLIMSELVKGGYKTFQVS